MSPAWCSLLSIHAPRHGSTTVLASSRRQERGDCALALRSGSELQFHMKTAALRHLQWGARPFPSTRWKNTSLPVVRRIVNGLFAEISGKGNRWSGNCVDRHVNRRNGAPNRRGRVTAALFVICAAINFRSIRPLHLR
jgi:hypothetical protein